MTSDEEPRPADTDPTLPKYYKPRDPSMELIHIERAGSWENRALSTGTVLLRSTREFPRDDLAAQFEEIDESEAMRLLGDGAIRFREEEAQRRPKVEAKPWQEPGPAGIGGWLILPILGLLASLIYNLVWLFRDYLPTMQGDVWPYLPTSARSLITFEGYANLVLIVGSVVLLVMLFLKRWILPRLMVGFYVFAFLVVVADSISILAIGPQLIPDSVAREQAGWSGGAVGQDIARAFWACVIWIPYFLISKRVKNTFVNPQLPRGATQTAAMEHQPSLPLVIGTVTPTGPQPASARRPRTSRAWVLGTSLVAALAVLAVLVWKCAAPSGMVEGSSAKAAQDGPSTPSLARTYTDPEAGYTFKYPDGWVLDNQPPASSGLDVGVYDPFGAGTDAYSHTAFTARVIRLDSEYDPSMLPEYQDALQQWLDEEMSRDSTQRTIKPPSQTTVGGIHGLEFTYSYSSDGVEVTVTECFLPQGPIAYEIAIQAASVAWETNEAALEAILTSFRPGPPQ